jgi:uncharacterized protein DUF6982
VSPAAAALLEEVPPLEESSSYRIKIATRSDLEVEQDRHDRRAHRRHRDQELRWIRSARLSAGQKVSIVDISAGGVLLDSPVPLRPDSILTLEIGGPNFDKSVPFRVLRCQIGALLPERTIYRGACQFTTLIELPSEPTAGARLLNYPGALLSLDLELKQLVERTGDTGPLGVLEVASVKQSLQSLRDRALKSPLDPMAPTLAGLLDRVVPALEQYRGLGDVLPWVEGQLRRTVPPVSLRLVEPNAPVLPGVKSVLIQVPGSRMSSLAVSVDLPRGFVVNDWQTRVLRVASRLIALLQRLERDTEVPPLRIVREASTPRASVVNQKPTGQPDDAAQTSGWQKIVVRYVEGQLLKGYTQDFNASRPQFSLWPSLTSKAHERVIVPLARLKGVFFVRDFAGNPGYVERTDSDQAQHGRRIEVTLVDDEVISGRTLSYRSDGHGFFVIPADPLANNIRIFVVSTAVRQVQFP